MLSTYRESYVIVFQHARRRHSTDLLILDAEISHDRPITIRALNEIAPGNQQMPIILQSALSDTKSMTVAYATSTNIIWHKPWP